MKLSIKTLKGSHFEVEVNPADTVANLKKIIETDKGSEVYPAENQMLIHSGKVLADESILEPVFESNSKFLVIMLKTKKPPMTAPASAPPTAQPVVPAPATPVPASATPAPATPVSAVVAPVPAAAPVSPLVQQILDLGGGSWDQETVVRALRAAHNNPDRAVEYLYTGIPERAAAPATLVPAPAVVPPVPGLAPATVPAPAAPAMPPTGVNMNPLDLFPQGLPAAGGGAPNQIPDMSQLIANPQMMQAVLQMIGNQNPELTRLIQENPAALMDLMNEAAGGEFGEVAATPEETEAMARLEAMGFDRDLVMEVFFACNKNEEQAANYLLDHMND